MAKWNGACNLDGVLIPHGGVPGSRPGRHKESESHNTHISNPGTYVIYLKGWSTGEPIFSIDHGTYDVLGLWINVSVKTSGNIVFKIPDGTNMNVLPGDCAEFEIEVTKNYSPGSLFLQLRGPTGSPI